MKRFSNEQAVCLRTAELVELFDGLLPADQVEDWGSHLEHCSVCQAQFETLASESTPPLSADPGAASPFLAAARQQLLVAGQSSLGENRDAPDSAAPCSTTQATPSESIGRYSDLQLIGRGGMGIVYRAIDDVLRRTVAIKRLSPHLVASPAARERFVREAQAAAAVVHEHVVSIFSVEEQEGVPFIVMQFVSGENLQERIDRVGPLELRETLRIGIEIASGLAAAHAEGVVHRDIKPSNILLENGLDRVKITDFGLARVAAAAGLTQKGEAPGTPQYMSAEQARGENVDCRSDLFSLGSVLYAMCTGRPPFEADTVLGTLRQVADFPARPIRAINPDVPGWLIGIIDRLHSKAPQQRYQTAEEVATTLLANGEGAQNGHTRGRRRWPFVAAAIAMVVGVAAFELTGVTSTLPAIAGLVRSNNDALAARGSSSTSVTPSVFKTPSSPDEGQAPLRLELLALNTALQRDPADTRSLLRRAEVHVALGELDFAVADYTQVISTAGPGAQRSSALMYRGSINGERGNWQAAIDDYSRFLDEDQNSASRASICSRFAAIYVAGPETLRNPQQAFELGQFAVQSSPTHAPYRTNLGAALYRLGQYPEAAQTLEAAAREKDGRSQWNQIFLAMAWHKLGATDKARSCFAAALTMVARNKFYLPLHKLLIAEAEALLAETASPNTAAPPSAAETTPSADPATAKLLAELPALDAAVQRDPADTRSLGRRAQVRAVLGEFDQAIADYTQIISVATVVRERGSALVGRAAIYAERGEWQAAIDGYARFLDENDATGAWIYGRLAAIYLTGPDSVRNPQKALELAQIAVRQPDAHAGFYTILGAALYRMGQYREAAQTLEAAAREKDGHTSFNQFFLAMTWHQLGEPDKARLCYKAALDLDSGAGSPLTMLALLRAEAEAMLEIQPRGS